MTKKVVLVTGGTGLVGNGIRIAHERDPRDDETFVFLSSKDADLTDKESTRKVNKGKSIMKNHFEEIIWFFIESFDDFIQGRAIKIFKGSPIL